jgi:hypothetical protein
MLPDIKHFPLNWIDGMKISSRDFITLENALLDQVRDTTAGHLHEYNYGLLPTNHPEADNYPNLVYDYSKNQLVLKECRALTPSGQRIEITEANYERKKYPAELPAVSFPVQNSGHFDVYIHIDLSSRLGAGEFAPNNPPRHLSVSPKYELSVRLHDGSYIEQENFLKISELEVREGRVHYFIGTVCLYASPCLRSGTAARHGSTPPEFSYPHGRRYQKRSSPGSHCLIRKDCNADLFLRKLLRVYSAHLCSLVYRSIF